MRLSITMLPLLYGQTRALYGRIILLLNEKVPEQ